MNHPLNNQETIAQLLESLIKMVGKGNQKIDGLQKRVCQLECAIRERELLEAASDLHCTPADAAAAVTGPPPEAH